MNAILELLNLSDNPVFHRYRRSQLRVKKALFWYLATVIITTFVVSLTYIIQTTQFDLSEEQAARDLWIPLLIIQGAILLLKGTGRTSAGLIQDKIDQTLDYQRLTPVSPLRNVVGYLFGIPVLEYVMFALTLPHLAFVVVKGNIPIGTVLSVYVVFFVCAIFYHMTAIAVGMVMKRWIWGYLLSVVSVAVLNLILPTVASQLGLKFLQYLSIFPVIGQKVAPLTIENFAANGGPPRQGFGPPPQAFGPPNQLGPGPNFGPEPFEPIASEAAVFSFADPVPFFNWMLSPFIFTLVLQIGLIVTLATMAIRRWEKETKHSLSKPYALGILGVFVVLVAGNLWPAITGQGLPFMIFGTREINAATSSVVAAGLPLVYSVAIWLLCIFLYFNVVPTHYDYIRGVRRARKLGQKAARPWDDDSANIPFMTLFVAVALVGYWILYGQMMDAGYMWFMGDDFPHWRLPFVLGLVLFYSLLLLQALQVRGTVLTILMLWLLPILFSIVTAAAMEDFTPFQSVIASLSPLATLIGTGMYAAAQADPSASQSEDIAVLLTGIRTGIFFLLVQIGFLSWRWRQLRQTLQ